jgi:hypothetical protein
MRSAIGHFRLGALVSLIGLLSGFAVLQPTAWAQNNVFPTQSSPKQLTATDLDLKPIAIAQINALMRDKANRSATQQKIDSNLIYATRMWRSVPVAEGVKSLQTGLTPDMVGRIRVVISCSVSDSLVEIIRNLGGTSIGAYPDFNAIEANIPLVSLESLARRTDVHWIRPSSRPISNTDSEGDITHGANLARSAPYNATGAGTTIGVLSDGDKYLSTYQYHNVPVTVIPGQDGPTSNSGEGTAMLEIVHDLAPGANLAFASAYNGELQFAQNIKDLHFKYNCDIIVDDVFYGDEPVFEDGPIAQAVEAVAADGALYFSSAGNQGSLKTGWSSVWEGNFTSGGAATGVLSGDGQVHVFGSALYNSIKDTTSNIFLFWSDKFGSSSNDYDLYVTKSDGSAIIAASTNTQNGTQDPIEEVAPKGNISSGSRIYVVLYNGNQRYLHLNTFGPRLTTGTTGQTHGHSSAASAFSVAASPAVSQYGGPYPNLFTIASPVEYFSSDGPRRMFYNLDGTVAGSGSLLADGGIVRQKPDIMAADAISTSVPGFGSSPGTFFRGTSAAAPHAAAIAALIKSYQHTESNPPLTINGLKLTTTELRSILTSTTLDTTGVGVDINSGYGIVMPVPALNFLNQFLNKSSITTGSVTTNSASITWSTKLPASSVVQYGPTASYGNTTSGALGVASHQVTLSGLTPNTVYHYSVYSNTATNSVIAQGPDQTFVTASAPATAPKILVTGVTITRNSTLKVTLTISNSGGSAANNVTLTRATLSTATLSSGLPTLGTINAGSSSSATLTFPGSVTTGASVLTVTGSYTSITGGATTFSATLRVTVP